MSETLSMSASAALELSQEYGLACFPLGVGGKKPLIPKDAGGTGFLDATCHAEQICSWWDRTPSANIGVVPGSAGYIVFDCDGPKGEELLRTFGAFNTTTAEVSTRRGCHLWFRLPAGVTVGNSAHPELDVRAHAGYVIAPPSVVAGHTYTWTRTLDQVQDCPDRLLSAVLDREAAVATTPRAGEDATPEIANTVFTSYVARAKRDGLTCEELNDSINRRVEKYIECVGHRSEGSRDNAAIQIARFLRVDMALSERATLEYLMNWNARNSPPLPHRVIQDKAARALRGARRAVGAGL